MTGSGGNFDDIARNLAEIVDEILMAERSRDRRVALIRHQVKRALSHGYKVGLANASRRGIVHADGRGDREA